MAIYWFLFSYFTAGSLLRREDARGSRYSYWFLTIGGLLIAAMIGLRYEVGGDWSAYERMYFFAKHASFGRALALGDPGYQLLNWTAAQMGSGIWLVNSICGIIFALGLLRFAQVQPSPWLAILVAVPYLVIVVAMGYSRQGVAIGILLAGLARLSRDGSALRFIAYGIAAALFHKTAIIMIPLVLLSIERSRLLNVILAIALGYTLYDIFLSISAERLVINYIEAEYTSEGAGIRIAMSILPAAIFFLKRRSLGLSIQEDRLWRNFSLAAVLMLALLFVLPSSTVVDRIALYLMPLQIAVLARLPAAFRNDLLKFLLVAYLGTVQFVWLNYADHADSWLPYRFHPIG